jgi:putative aldouronate transport system substrate-binding protein
MRKIVLITLALVMAGTAVFARGAGQSSSQSTRTVTAEPGPFGRYQSPITLTTGVQADPNDQWPAGDSPLSNMYTRHVEEQLNVKTEVVWTASSSDYNQRVNLAITSNSLPNIMVVNDTQLNQLVKSNQLADLTQAYNDYASDTIRRMIASSGGKAIENGTFNGKLYGLTSTSDGDFEMVWIRKDWLDKLGLQPPKTVSDVKAIARAFVDRDPGGNGPGRTIGISGAQNGADIYSTFLTSGTNIYGFEPFFEGLNSYPGWWVRDANNEPAYGSTLPETRAALQELATCYREGLIDPEMGIRQNAAEAVISGRSGIFCGGWWMGYAMLPDTIKNNPAANFQCYAIPVGRDGVYRPRASSASYNYVVINKNYPYPEVAIKLNNVAIRDESLLDVRRTSQGGLGGGMGSFPGRIAFGMLDESTYTLKALRDVLSGAKTISNFTDEDFRLYKLLKNDLEKIKAVKKEPYSLMDISAWNPNADITAWQRSYSIMVGWASLVDNPVENKYSLTHSLTATMESRWSNLKALEDETFMKIIMNQASIETFDQFVRDWKAQGGDRITQEVKELLAAK